MKIYILIISFILISCSQSDDFNENGKCKLIFSDKVFQNNSNNEFKDTILYRTHYFYNLKNKLQKRVKYKYLNFSLHYNSTDSLTYDSQGRLNKIFTKTISYSSYEYLNSNKRASRIYYYNQKLSSTENIIYDNKNRVNKTVRTYNKPNSNVSYTYKVEAEYKYEQNNLSEIITYRYDKSPDNIVTEYHTFEKFENYDKYENPFKNLPFIDLRGISESENNYSKYSQQTFISYNSSRFTLESSSYSVIDNNNLEYLENSKYECN